VIYPALLFSCDIYLRLGLEKDEEIRVLFDMGREKKRHTPARVECCCSWVVVIAKRSRAASTSPAYIYSLSKPLVVYISPIVLYIYREAVCVCVCMRDYILSSTSCCLYSPGWCVRLALSKYQQGRTESTAASVHTRLARLSTTAGCLGPAFVPIKWSVLTRCTIFHPSSI
jgi:hypothetical protein